MLKQILEGSSLFFSFLMIDNTTYIRQEEDIVCMFECNVPGKTKKKKKIKNNINNNNRKKRKKIQLNESKEKKKRFFDFFFLCTHSN